MSRPSHLDLGYRPRAWQRECHLARKRFTVLALHRRAGKTLWGLMELLNGAIACRLELSNWFYLAPFLSQAKSIAWSQLKQLVEPLRRIGAVEIREVELAIVFKHNGATIRLFGADKPDAMRGVRLDGVVIDETGQIKPELWQDVLQPALSDRKGWAVFIGTPSGINLLSELWHKAQSLPEWHAARYTVHDTEAIEADEVERLRRDMPDRSFAREYLCDWSAGGDDQLISLADVEAAAARRYTMKDVASAARILGVDPARFGDDRSVIVRRQGLQMFPPIVLRGADNMELAARVAHEITEWRPDAVFIDSGAGAGVIDRLRQLGHDCIEVPFGGKAVNPELFTNRRSEMWWGLREWILSGGSVPNDAGLKTELATPIYSFDAHGKKRLESKDDIKRRLSGGASPDQADALALTFAMPVAAPDRFERFKLDHRDLTVRPPPKTYGGDDYDPMDLRGENHPWR